MSEQKPNIDQVDPQPIDPVRLKTEHGYQPDYPVYPGEETRVLDPAQAHVMASESKNAEEMSKILRNVAASNVELADQALSPDAQKHYLDIAERQLGGSKDMAKEAHRQAIGAAKKFVKNEKTQQRLSSQIQDVNK